MTGPQPQLPDRPVQAVALFAALLAIYLAVPQQRVSSDNLSHQLTALSLATGHRGHLERLTPELKPSSTPRRVYLLPAIGGGWVSGYGLGVPLALLPAYLPALALGVGHDDVLSGRFNQGVAAVWMALAVVLFALTTPRLASRGATWLATAALALGSSLLSLLSREIWQHSLVVLLQAGILFLLVVVMPRRPRAGAVAAGLLAGWSVAARPTALLYALCWLWAAGRLDRRAARWFLLALAPWLAVVAAYNWATFGSPWVFGQLIIGAARFGDEAGHTLGLTPLASLAGALLSPGRGFFVYSPVFLLTLLLPAVALAGRRPTELPSLASESTRRLRLVLAPALAMIAANLVTVAAWKEWWGGFTFGPRYISEVLVAWCLLLAYVVDRFMPASRSGRWRLWGLATALLVLSCLTHATGLLVGPYGPMSHSRVFQPDRDPEVLWRWSSCPPLHNLRVWLRQRSSDSALRR